MTTLAAMWGKSRLVRFVLLAVTMLAAVLIGTVIAPPAAAQGGADFELKLTAGGPVDGSTEVVVVVDPAISSVAALQLVLVYDDERVSPTRCLALSDLGACNTTTAGSLAMAIVSAGGWDAETSLFQVSFESLEPLHPQDLSVTITEALTTSGDSASGSVVALLPVPGDVSCNRTVNILDALLIAQHIVGIRDGSEVCPLVNDDRGLNLAVADVNGSGTVSIADAVLIAQCVDGRANQLCPQ